MVRILRCTRFYLHRPSTIRLRVGSRVHKLYPSNSVDGRATVRVIYSHKCAESDIDLYDLPDKQYTMHPIPIYNLEDTIIYPNNYQYLGTITVPQNGNHVVAHYMIFLEQVNR